MSILPHVILRLYKVEEQRQWSSALNKNFLYFPLGEHFEQKLVSDKLARLGLGVKMSFLETDENTLSKVVLENLGRPVDYGQIEIDGAVKAAEFIQPLL